ncbi:uncharacterized protein LOC141908007 [Tubulanus polymorphus]|uniref:uncharacterized protein LOC141908007 n=1 Tax=Tubulanus polymorphus TaxID=672921 RepID=UPI003DA5CA8B
MLTDGLLGSTIVRESLVTISSALIVCSLVVTAATTPCPGQCTCLDTGFEVRVKCVGPFNELPIGIPVGVTSLVLSGADRSDAALESIGRETFRNFTRLQELNINRVRLKYLHDEAFRRLSKLSKLILSGNEIERIPPSLFVNLYNLVFVDFSDNLIDELPGDLLLLPRLSVLSLKNNKIQNLSSGIFENVARLQFLDVSGNPLQHVQAETFRGLPLLRTIRMNNCSFVEINNYLLYYLQNITTIELKDNKLSKMDATLFNTTLKLKELHLDGNEIIYLEPGFLHGLKLRTLGLSRNKIVSMSIGAFQQFTTEILKLNDNWIKYLSPALFRHMNETLRFLYLGGNPLTNIQKSTFFGLPRLRTLDLSRTRIASLPVDLFAGLELQFVNLSRNNFSSFDNETLQSLRPVELVDLRGNPWECTCHIRPLQRWLIANSYGQDCPPGGSRLHPFKLFTEMRKEFNCLECGTYPSIYRGRNLLDLSPEETQQCEFIETTTTSPIPLPPVIPSRITLLEIILLVIAAILLLTIIILIIVCCYLKNKSKRHKYDVQRSSASAAAVALHTAEHSHWSHFPGSPEVASDAAWGNPELWSIEAIECVDAAKISKNTNVNGVDSNHYNSAYHNPSAKQTVARLESVL